MLGSFLFPSLTTKLNLFVKNVGWPEITWLLVLCTGIKFLFAPVLLWSKPRSFMRISAQNSWQINATVSLDLSVGVTTNSLWV